MTASSTAPLQFSFLSKASGGGHLQIKVYAGTTPGSLGCCGGLVMRKEEWEVLRKLLGTALLDGVRVKIGEEE